jgi:hypothetical protein
MIGGTNQQAFSQIVNEASRTKNIQAAIERHGAALSPQEKNILLSLTAADLAALERINGKLAPLGVKAYVD